MAVSVAAALTEGWCLTAVPCSGCARYLGIRDSDFFSTQDLHHRHRRNLVTRTGFGFALLTDMDSLTGADISELTSTLNHASRVIFVRKDDPNGELFVVHADPNLSAIDNLIRRVSITEHFDLVVVQTLW